MSGFRDTAWLREAHDRMECPPECPICSRIESYEPPGRGARELLTTFDYEEYR